MSKKTLLAASVVLGGLCTAATGTATYYFLYSTATGKPIMQIAAPKANASCSTRSLNLTVAASTPMQVQTCIGGRCSPTDPNSLQFRDRIGRVLSSNVRLGIGDPGAAGPPEPVVNPTDKLEYLCREDEEGQQCICIPFVHRDGK